MANGPEHLFSDEVHDCIASADLVVLNFEMVYIRKWQPVGRRAQVSTQRCTWPGAGCQTPFRVASPATDARV